MTLILVLLIVLVSGPVGAMDLGVAGGLSGAGQASTNALANMQTGLMQSILQTDREAHDQEMLRRQQEHEMQLREREYQHRLEMQQQQAQQSRPIPQTVAKQPTAMQIQTAKLDTLRPHWRQIVGPQPTKTHPELSPYREWLTKQPKAYQRRLAQSVDADEINESIGEFLEAK